MIRTLTVHGYPNNGHGKPRKPLVHLLGTSGYGDVVSISFHPKHADAVTRAVRAAAKSATAGRKRKPVTLEFPESET